MRDDTGPTVSAGTADPEGPAPLVTISAAWGTGGSWIAPRVADELGVSFVDRALTREVAHEVAEPLRTAGAERRPLGAALSRALHELTHPRAAETSDAGQVEVDRALLSTLVDGGGVVLGRAGAVILQDQQRALHVRLIGRDDQRIAQGMAVERVDEPTARWRLASGDVARDVYVQHFHQVDPQDPWLYHLTIDSTRLPLPVCVQTIATAARARLTA